MGNGPPKETAVQKTAFCGKNAKRKYQEVDLRAWSIETRTPGNVPQPGKKVNSDSNDLVDGHLEEFEKNDQLGKLGKPFQKLEKKNGGCLRQMVVPGESREKSDKQQLTRKTGGLVTLKQKPVTKAP